MKNNLRSLLISASVFIGINTTVQGQITLLQDHQNTSSAVIGTSKGITFREAGFSGLYPIPNTNGKEFWTLSDRGVNVDCANANPAGCHPTYDKMYSFPSYAPKIHRIRINNGTVQILQTITVKRPDGTTASGIINPTGLGSTNAEVASTDTVLDCANFLLKTTPKDTFGIDPEGIVVDKDGNFWLCEEGGATIWKLNANGLLLKRYTPYANLPGAQPVDSQIDSVFKYRKNNRGFEGISIAPNGKIYAIIQSPILYPNQTVGENSRIHRILEIDPVTNVQRMIVYLNDGIIGSGGNQIRLRDWKIGDMAAVNDSTFLVLEAAARGTTDIKRLYMININQATAVHSGLYSGVTLEALTDSTGLANNGIKAVKKTLVMDLLANGWPAVLDKAEGLAVLNDSTIAICNDNDFGQTCPNADGIPIATTNTSHVIVYRLSGSNKLLNYKKPVETLISLGETGAASSQTPYLTPALPGITFTSILSAGDSMTNGYKMAGTPDGTGAFDNGNGTFTLLVNHEFGNTAGVNRAHGAKGAFVSKWVINKNDLSVVSGSDLIQKVNLWNGTGYTLYNPSDTTSKKAFNRFCSADLPAVTAFYNATTGLGTQERIFMNGEEAGNEGRAFGHIATGTNAGTTYELPYLGKFSWENSVANPMAQDKTIVAGTDDSTPGQVYMYVGTKTNSGTEVDRAGLTNGKLYGVAVTGLTNEASATFPAPNTAFTLVDLGVVRDSTGASINSRSNSLGVTNFLRPEDGAWDPSNPNDFYFVTTNGFGAASRMWRLRFSDISNPTAGGTITAVLDGTEGQQMMDNITLDNFGHVFIQEDVGNNAHNGKMWQYTIGTDKFTLIAQHDANRFITGAANFLTQDEEASGVIDVQGILGAGNFLLVDQAHYSLPGELVEGGQILKMYNPATANSFAGASPSSSQTPYLTSKAPGVTFNAIISAGDSMTNGYKMAGTPDGTGAFDNGNGTFTLLVNHEFGNTAGVNRAHGAKGAFVSKWVINKNDLSVVSGSDLIQKVNLWNGTGYTLYNPSDTTSKKAFNRFCSADLPAVTAFYNATTGLGTQERIFMNGEEAGNEGRAFGHIATGTNAGTTYELPYLGKFSWENSVANPMAQDKTIVAGTDDSTPGQVYMYVGTKTNSGTEVDRAGLTNGKLYGVAVTGLTNEASATFPAPNTAFTLVDLGVVRDSTGASINSRSNSLGVTNFLRPEDGAWDPSNPNDFYFVTTNGFGAASRMWRLRFSDISNPTAGGTITAVLDGTEGQQMMDNITLDNFGHVFIQEDVGNNAHNGKMWQYTIANDQFIQIAQHDSTRFINGVPNFLTQDEEASGVIDVQGILGAGNFLLVDQAHYSLPGELVEGGQILKMYNAVTFNSNPEISVSGNSVNIVDGDASPTVSDNTNFGNAVINVAQTKNFLVQNAGPGSLVIKGINFSGTSAFEFSQVSVPSFPLTIASGASQIITVRFIPVSAGNHAVTINMATNDFDEGVFDFVLQGTVQPADINVKGGALNISDGDLTPNSGDNTDFGGISMGSNITKTFTIENTGSDSLRISGISFSGTNGSEFTLSGVSSFPWVIAPATTRAVPVKFAPVGAGSRSATITIASNDPDEGGYDFALQGQSLIPEIQVQGNGLNIADGDHTPLTTNGTDFGNVNKFSTKNGTFDIRNTGFSDLNVSAITITGTNASEFTLVSAPSMPLTIPANSHQVITVQFAPLAAGLRTSDITIVNSDLDEGTYDFALQGMGLSTTGITSLATSSFVTLYPNPAGDEAMISMTTMGMELVTVKVFDMEGRMVLPLLEKTCDAGEQHIMMKTAALGNGVYFIEVISGDRTAKIKMVVAH